MTKKINKSEISTLMETFGYKFNDENLLLTALSHRSFGKDHNERLEFLGDSVLNFVVAAELFARFPDAREGQLSRLRAYLVREDTLFEIASELNLPDYLRLGIGESRSGGAFRPSILSDTLEAVVGAIYIDANLNDCYKVVAKIFEERLESVSLDEEFKDPKSLLQEIAQAHKMPLPEYSLLEKRGKEHQQVFRVACNVGLLNHPSIGDGTSRRRAEQEAARRALEKIEQT